ncbi:MAG: hypothetical protein V7K64_25950 [Nostoc sp.]|nr:hypothetical protein [Nostoc sp. JL34]
MRQSVDFLIAEECIGIVRRRISIVRRRIGIVRQRIGIAGYFQI